jgi:hypothetical protein
MTTRREKVDFMQESPGELEALRIQTIHVQTETFAGHVQTL